MTVLENLLARRSVRTYAGESIPEDLLRQVVASGIASESGRGKQPWHLVVVQKRETLDWLSEARSSGSARMLKGADAAIAVFGNPEVADTWVEDCSIVMAHMHLAADSLGLGSCWIQGRMRDASDQETTCEAVRRILGVPEPYRLEAILSLGVPDSHKPARVLDDLPWDKVHRESFQGCINL